MRETFGLISGTKNEARSLPKFFEHHVWADEIILMDSFSVDETYDICAKYGRKFYKAELSGNASKRLNLVLKECKSDWFIVIDPDEFISEQLKSEIMVFLSQKDNEFVAFEFPRTNYFIDKPLLHGGWSGYALKIFRKGHVEFQGNSYHEKPIISGKIGRLKGEVLHYPNPNIHWVMEKFNYISEFDLNEYFNRHGVLTPGKFKWLLLTRPLKNFWKCYVKKQGYKDGLHGFIYAALIWAQDVIRICKYGEKFILKNPNLMPQDKLPDPWECRKR